MVNSLNLLRYTTFKTVTLAVLSVLFLFAQPAAALPEQPDVVHGQASIGTAGSTMTIDQLSQKAIINWNGFSISANELVRFLQPSQTSAVLNRVTGIDPSVIHGVLQGNGQVFLINPNGVLIGPGGMVQTGSFLASTLNVSNSDFIDGNMRFTQDPNRDLAAIVNQGQIRVADGGFTILTAPSISHEGLIIAKGGEVRLGAGTESTVNFDGRGLVHFSLGERSGELDGTLVLSQAGTHDILRQVVADAGVQEAGSLNSSGMIEASGVLFQGGNVNLPGVTNSADIEVTTSGDANLGTHFALGGHSIVVNAGGDITFDTLVAEQLNGAGGLVQLTAGGPGGISANQGGQGIAATLVVLSASRGSIDTSIAANAVSASAPVGSVVLMLQPGLIHSGGTSGPGLATSVGANGTALSIDAGADVFVDSVNTVFLEQISGRNISIVSQTGSIADAGNTPGGDNRDIVATGNVFLSAGEFLATIDSPLEVDIDGDLTVTAGSEVQGLSGVLIGRVGSNYTVDPTSEGVVLLNFFTGADGVKQAQRNILDAAETAPGETHPGGATPQNLYFLVLNNSLDEEQWLQLLRGAVVWEDDDDEAGDEDF